MDINNYTKLLTNVYKFDNVVLNKNVSTTLMYSQGIDSANNNKNVVAIEKLHKCLLLCNDTTENHKLYDIYIQLALLTSIQYNDQYNDILKYYTLAMNACPDRAEPYFYLGIYCNQTKRFEKAYELLSIAKNMSYDSVKNKYNDVKENSYGINVYDELSVACYWLHKNEEGLEYLKHIIDMDRFKHIKTRLDQNLQFYKLQMKK